MDESTRLEIRAILRAVAGSDLRIIDPQLAAMVERGITLTTTADDRARAAELHARISR